MSVQKSILFTLTTNNQIFKYQRFHLEKQNMKYLHGENFDKNVKNCSWKLPNIAERNERKPKQMSDTLASDQFCNLFIDSA